jgi:predicted RNase H-like HicB family nuclease
MVIEQDETGWYVGSVPALPGCHTQGRTIEELTERIKEAIALCACDAHETEFVGVRRVSVA